MDFNFSNIDLPSHIFENESEFKIRKSLGIKSENFKDDWLQNYNYDICDYNYEISELEVDHNELLNKYSDVTKSSKKEKISKWRKSEDRLMIRAILDLSSSNFLTNECLNLTMSRSKEWKDSWSLIKSSIKTERSERFLQTRYRVLLK